jgi:DNA-binding IclR family transcriptional regulator
VDVIDVGLRLLQMLEEQGKTRQKEKDGRFRE